MDQYTFFSSDPIPVHADTNTDSGRVYPCCRGCCIICNVTQSCNESSQLCGLLRPQQDSVCIQQLGKKNVFQHVKNELNGCKGDRWTQIPEVQGTCTTRTWCALKRQVFLFRDLLVS